jgi:glutathione S-transferase
MAASSKLVLHAVPFSHPVLAVSTALDHFGLEYETVMLVTGQQGDEVEKVYGEGKRTVPGILVDGEPVHGTIACFEKIDEIADGSSLYPAAVAAAVREAERGLAEDLQTAARVLIFGALHFRPESMGTFAGAGPLDPAGTDFAIKMVRRAWRYLDITAERIASELDRLPEHVGIADELVESGVIGGDEPTAADFQIGSSLHLLRQIGDVRPLIDGRGCVTSVDRWFEPGAADVPAGAFPAGWAPAA